MAHEFHRPISVDVLTRIATAKPRTIVATFDVDPDNAPKAVPAGIRHQGGVHALEHERR